MLSAVKGKEDYDRNVTEVGLRQSGRLAIDLLAYKFIFVEKKGK